MRTMLSAVILSFVTVDSSNVAELSSYSRLPVASIASESGGTQRHLMAAHASPAPAETTTDKHLPERLPAGATAAPQAVSNNLLGGSAHAAQQISSAPSDEMHSASSAASSSGHGGAAELVPESELTDQCDASLVDRACQAMNANTPHLYSNPFTANSKFVHASEIASITGADLNSTLGLLEALQMANTSLLGNTSKYGVSCLELCAKLVATSPPNTLPSASDVGCYIAKSGGAPVCDLAIAPQQLESVKFVDLTVLGDVKMLLGEVAPAHSAADPQDVALETAQAEGGSQAFESWAHSRMSKSYLRRKLLSLFRIFAVSNNRLDYHGVVHGEAQSMVAATHAPTAAPALHQLPSHSVVSHQQTAHRRLQGLAMSADEVIAQSLQLAVKAKALVNQAIMNLARGEASSIFGQWFGIDVFDPSRTAVIKNLNEITDKLDNMHFTYPGSICKVSSPEMAVYTAAGGAEQVTADGRYKLQLCDPYFSLTESEQIQVLIHKAGRFRTSLLKDFAVGQSSCLALSEFCDESMDVRSRSCVRARTNADTTTFFAGNAAARHLISHTTTSPAMPLAPIMPAVVPTPYAKGSDAHEKNMWLLVGLPLLLLCCCCTMLAALWKCCHSKASYHGYHKEDLEAEPYISARDAKFKRAAPQSMPMMQSNDYATRQVHSPELALPNEPSDAIDDIDAMVPSTWVQPLMPSYNYSTVQQVVSPAAVSMPSNTAKMIIPTTSVTRAPSFGTHFDANFQFAGLTSDIARSGLQVGPMQ